MSAKKASKYVPSEIPVTSATATATGDGTSTGAEATGTSWIDSADPKRRQIAQVVLWLLWIYVAALWLLALDQWFNWGIFGAKIAPLP